MEELVLRIETARSGPFTLTPGVSLERLSALIQRVDDAHQRFIGSPLSQIATELEKEVVVSSIFGTNTIEGGRLSEEETRDVLALDQSRARGGAAPRQESEGGVRPAETPRRSGRNPNEPFVRFHLEGMRLVVNQLHDRVNQLIGVLLFRNRARDMLEGRDINARQYTILMRRTSRSFPSTRAAW